MNRKNAIAAVRALFSSYRMTTSGRRLSLTKLTIGKLYELYVLSELVQELAARGFTLRFVGTTLMFKASPGMIKLSDPHFEVRAPNGPLYRIFTDIEFETLGALHAPRLDLSRRHELDIVVTTRSSGYPTFGEIALGVECKAHANFTKTIVKAVLGVRRELSLLHQSATPLSVALGSPIAINASPGSEFWLTFLDPKGTNYAASPGTFAIEFKQVAP